MKRLWLAIPILAICFILPSVPVLAGGEECDGCPEAGTVDDSGMDVIIGVSGNSEVEVNTGDNSEVEINTGVCNDVFINGQDVNEPTVISITNNVKQDYGIQIRQRISKIEYNSNYRYTPRQ